MLLNDLWSYLGAEEGLKLVVEVLGVLCDKRPVLIGNELVPPHQVHLPCQKHKCDQWKPRTAQAQEAQILFVPRVGFMSRLVSLQKFLYVLKTVRASLCNNFLITRNLLLDEVVDMTASFFKWIDDQGQGSRFVVGVGSSIGLRVMPKNWLELDLQVLFHDFKLLILVFGLDNEDKAFAVVVLHKAAKTRLEKLFPVFQILRVHWAKH